MRWPKTRHIHTYTQLEKNSEKKPTRKRKIQCMHSALKCQCVFNFVCSQLRPLIAFEYEREIFFTLSPMQKIICTQWVFKCVGQVHTLHTHIHCGKNTKKAKRGKALKCGWCWRNYWTGYIRKKECSLSKYVSLLITVWLNIQFDSYRI